MDVTNTNPGRARADIILVNGTILTMDKEYGVIHDGAVAISGRDISAIGPPDAVLAHYQSEHIIDCSDCVIIPGLINAHTHLPMSLLRGLADDLRLDVWLHGYIIPVEREFVNPEFCFLGTQLSCAELIRGGVTCFADMYYFEEEVAWAAVQAGMRGICGETITKTPTPDASDFEVSLRYCSDLISHWSGHETIIPAPAPHSVYMCTDEILRRTTQMALAANTPQLIHLDETNDETVNWLRTTGQRPARWLEDQGVLAAHTIAAHCVHASEEELDILKNNDVGIIHNPTSNLKLASGIAPVAQMLSRGMPVGLGTDGCASNNDQDMLEEMRLAALLSKAAVGDPMAVPARSALAMATINGARALHLDDIIGSLEVGKRADIAVVRMNQLYQIPRFETTGQNVYSRLVYATKSSDVRDVIINGKIVLRDAQLLTIDEPRVMAQASQLTEGVNHFFVAREHSLLDKLVAIGGSLEQREMYEIQAKGVITSLDGFLEALHDSKLTVTLHTSRNQYDTYFFFDDPQQGRLRYREDNVIEEDGTLTPSYTLTLVGPVKEAEYEHSVVLSRSRFTASADRSLRFYREYFNPAYVREITKHRERYHIRYQGVDFAVNIDQITLPAQPQVYLEIKSRTWSEQDAFRKAALIGDLLSILGTNPRDMRIDAYVDLFHDDPA